MGCGSGSRGLQRRLQLSGPRCAPAGQAAVPFGPIQTLWCGASSPAPGHPSGDFLHLPGVLGREKPGSLCGPQSVLGAPFCPVLFQFARSGCEAPEAGGWKDEPIRQLFGGPGSGPGFGSGHHLGRMGLIDCSQGGPPSLRVSTSRLCSHLQLHSGTVTHSYGTLSGSSSVWRRDGSRRSGWE